MRELGGRKSGALGGKTNVKFKKKEWDIYGPLPTPGNRKKTPLGVVVHPRKKT